MYQKTRFSHKYLIISIDIDFIRFCFPFFYIRWLMGDNLLPTDIVGYAHNFWSYTMGVLSFTEMGRCVGKVADTLPDGAFLWGHVVLRRLFL